VAPEIKVNGEAVEVDLSSAKYLSEVLDALARDNLGPDEIITGITLNNARVEKESISTVGATPLSGIASLDISTHNSPQVKAAMLLGEMRNYLQTLADGAGEVSDTFRVGSPEKANAMLHDALSGLSALIELIQTAKILSRSDMSEFVVEGMTMSALEEKLLETLTDFEKGQKDNDWVTVADLLEYELAPIIDKWIAFIPLMEAELLKENR